MMILTMRRLDARLGIGFFLLLALIVANAYLANRAIYSLVDYQRLVVHTWQVRTELHDLSTQFESSIAQGRGYVLMDERHFLEGFQIAQRNIVEDLKRIKVLTLDNLEQHKNANTLQFLMDEQMEFARGNVTKLGKQPLRNRVVTPQLMSLSLKRVNAIQSLVKHMDEIEVKFAREREHQALLNERQTRLTIFGATTAAALALIATFSLIRQTFRDREASETAIRTYNTELEARVEERTQSLQSTNERLQAANQELEAFSYTVSHDLRAPLRHVFGFADLLEKKSGALLDEAGKRYLGLIKEAGRRGGLLIDDLLAFSRMSRTELNQGLVSMSTKVEMIHQELLLEHSNQEIVWIVDELPLVWGDAAMLRLVWRNLLDNAVKYSSRQQVPHIEIGYLLEASELTFFVRDNGVGFDMAHAENLFGVFQRLDESDEFEGTGIGLATVRRIVARHGGRTWAESKPDAGATFWFTLPRERLRTQENRKAT
jgi:signal transduction histidine kinase